jgi:hypothetical protein
MMVMIVVDWLLTYEHMGGDSNSVQVFVVVVQIKEEQGLIESEGEAKVVEKEV